MILKKPYFIQYSSKKADKYNDMRFLLSFLILVSCVSCNQISSYWNLALETTSTQIAASISGVSFSVQEEADLKNLFSQIYYAEDCSEVFYSTRDNDTLYNLENEYSLQSNFLFYTLTSRDEGLMDLSAYKDSRESYVAFTVIASWKKHYPLTTVQETIKSIKGCN